MLPRPPNHALETQVSTLTLCHTSRTHTSPTPHPPQVQYMESYESRHSDHRLAAAVAAALGISRPSLRLDSQAKYGALARGDASIFMRFPPPTYQEKVLRVGGSVEGSWGLEQTKVHVWGGGPSGDDTIEAALPVWQPHGGGHLLQQWWPRTGNSHLHSPTLGASAPATTPSCR